MYKSVRFNLKSLTFNSDNQENIIGKIGYLKGAAASGETPKSPTKLSGGEGAM